MPPSVAHRPVVERRTPHEPVDGAAAPRRLWTTPGASAGETPGAPAGEKGTAPVGGTTGAVDAPSSGGEEPVRRSTRPTRGSGRLHGGPFTLQPQLVPPRFGSSFAVVRLRRALIASKPPRTEGWHPAPRGAIAP